MCVDMPFDRGAPRGSSQHNRPRRQLLAGLWRSADRADTLKLKRRHVRRHALRPRSSSLSALLTTTSVRSVIRNDKKGAIEEEPPVVMQESPIVEFGLDPFCDSSLITAGQDGAARVFKWAADGLTGVCDSPAAVMQHGDKRVVLAEFHPLAQGLALTAAGDYSVKLWDASRPDSAALDLPAAHKGVRGV